jgi:deoxyribonuclease IV
LAAAERAHAVGANTLQIFTSSPRMWRGSRLDPADVRLFRQAREKFDLYPLVVHDNYLINLASCDPVIRAHSIASYRGEIERALAVDADSLVAHPGSCRGQAAEQAIENLVAGVAEAARGLGSKKLTLLWEITAGQGECLGSRVEELRRIGERSEAVADFSVAYCLDTAHVFAAGLDFVATAEALGWERVRVIHTNDSKAPFASRVDRHQHIGGGYIGEKAFQRILTHPKLRGKPFILETPVDQDDDDRRNIETLKRLCRKSRTITARSS